MSHFLLHWLGLDNVSGPIYSFWSGSGGDLLSAIPLFGGLFMLFRKHVCHEPGCLRLGLHRIEGTPLTVCRRHHPALTTTDRPQYTEGTKDKQT